MCGRFGLAEMAPKELWKAKVGFQKQKLIALHLAFQCHVALSYTHAEWEPLPRPGTEGSVLEPGIPGGPRSPGRGSEVPPLSPQGMRPCLLPESQPRVGAGREGLCLCWRELLCGRKSRALGMRRLGVGWGLLLLP